MLPRAANLATLAVVLAATWWSGAQRPAGQPALATTETAIEATSVATVVLPPQQAGGLSATTGSHAAATWPTPATAVPRDGLQAVGFLPRTQR